MRGLPFGHPPSSTDLLEHLAPRVTDAIIHEIAHADYGTGAELVDPVLRDIRSDRAVPPGEPSWELDECLQLVTNHSWDQMDHTDHVLRLFSCAVLFAYHTRGNITLLSHDGTMARMVESAIELGVPTVRHCASFTAWLAEADDPSWSRSFHALAMLMLEVTIDAHLVSPRVCNQLEELVQSDVQQCAEELQLIYGDAPKPWLLCLDSEQQQFDPWRHLAMIVLRVLPTHHPARAVAERLSVVA